MNAKEVIKHIEAYDRGEPIQGSENGVWVDVVCLTDLLNYAASSELRIKPQPRKYWVVETMDTGNHVFTDQKYAQRFAAAHSPSSQSPLRVIPVVQVLD